MTRATRGQRRRLAAVPLLLAAATALILLGRAAPGGGAEAGPNPVAQPSLGVIDGGGTLFGASPGEAAGEVWSLGGGRILRHTDADGWSAVDAPLDAEGKAINDLSFATGPLAGRSTDDGAVVVLANDMLLTRDPGGRFQAAPDPGAAPDGGAPPTSGTPATTGTPPTTGTPATTTTPPATATAPLHAGEQLYGAQPLLAPVETGGHAGAFVVPTAGDDGVQDAVLHFDGSAWTREAICIGTAPACDMPTADFAVTAIDAAGASHAWLLATGTTSTAGLVLLHRDDAGADPVWRPVSLGSSPFAQRSQTLGATTVKIVPRPNAQPLTATTQGVWADASVTAGGGTAQDATLFFDASAGRVAATWCDLTGDAASLCDRPLGTALPDGDGRSFAWAAGAGPYGERIITGLDQGAILRLDGDGWTRVPTAGRGVGADRGAAFAAPDEGWLGGIGPVHYGTTAEPDQLRTWPVPFRHPLTAIAAEPGKPVGAIDAQALAVGDQGEVARYTPGQGWLPESLLTATGARATPRLRGVAWPSEDRAFAVGDNAEMWLWREETGLWEPDPAKPPNLALANFTGIAFDPGNPDRGYAIGKQGVLLRYDREWTQEPLPAGLGDANFTSIAFAGHEAIVTYKTPLETAQAQESYRGGIIVNDGSGWRVDDGIAAALPPPDAPAARGDVVGMAGVPERVAGLPDGSAVVATLDGHVAERDGADGAWRDSRLEPAGYPVALTAFHEEGTVRAAMSVDVEDVPNDMVATDIDTILHPAPAGQAPVFLDPYPIPGDGYVLRQTAQGWHDEQHLYSSRSTPARTSEFDLPERPDAVLAFLTDPFGRSGWAVGGDVQIQSASVVRYPDDGQGAPGAATAPIPVAAGQATFAIGGGAACLSACADLQPVGAGPWRWLPAAVARAGQVGGVRAFLDTGPGTARASDVDDFAHEQAAAAQRLTSAAGTLPVYAAASDQDVDGSGSLGTFVNAFSGGNGLLGETPGGAAITPVPPAAGPGQAYYAFDTAGDGGAVRVVVLDTSSGGVDLAQRCWLAGQLTTAGSDDTPAIVVGNAPLGGNPTVAQILVSGTTPDDCSSYGTPSAGGTGASAFFYDAQGRNLTGTIAFGADQIPAWGTGSLGYIDQPSAQATDAPANSGFLIAQVDVAGRDQGTNRAPVSAQLIPNIGELAVDATDGTLLRRSQVALFDGLARRPRAGLGCKDAPSCQIIPDPYVPIPADCVGEACTSTVPPQYTFTSSNPAIADFVARDATSTNPRRVLLDNNGNPVPSSSSGLLCAYNAGTTTITLTAGGLTYSEPVTVQAGSVRRPCGTVRAPDPGQRLPHTEAPGIDTPQIAPATDTPPAGGAGPLPPPPAPAPVKAVKPPPHRPVSPLAPAFVAPFLPVTSGLTQVVATPPPPPPTAARPAPPSGTSSAQVYQSAVAPEKQREEEPSVETASNNMVRYEAGAPLPRYVSQGGAFALLLLAGLALAGAWPRARTRRPYAYNYSDDHHRPTPRT